MRLLLQIIGEKDADGFYWGECGGRSGYVPCNMVSEVQVDDERVARELLKVRKEKNTRGSDNSDKINNNNVNNISSG